MSDQMQHLIANSEGFLPTYAWPGAYAIAYVADDGEYLCRDCASEFGHYDGISWNSRDGADGWRIDGYVTADWHDIGEGDWVCAHCATVIDTEPGG